jgi:hypothetical protein
MSAVGRSMVYDPPMPSWPVDRATMLGDAAHRTLASGGNGATTAIHDTVRLCTRLAEYQTDLARTRERGRGVRQGSTEEVRPRSGGSAADGPQR